MIGQATGYGRSQQHLSPFALSGGFSSAQFVMGPAEVVGASEQVHARFQSHHATSRVTAFAGQAGKPLAHGPIQSLDKGGVEHRSSLGVLQQLLGRFQRSLSHPSGDLHHPFLLRVFDDRGDTELGPHLQAGSPTSCGLFDFLPKRPSNTAWVGVPAICTHQQRTQRLTAGAHLREQPVCQTPIARQTDHPAQPQACRHHHSQAHPSNHLVAFHPNFIRLDMHQVQLPLLHYGLVDLLAVLPRSVSPACHRAFIQPKRLHNRLHRTAISQQRDDYHDQRIWLA